MLEQAKTAVCVIAFALSPLIAGVAAQVLGITS